MDFRFLSTKQGSIMKFLKGLFSFASLLQKPVVPNQPVLNQTEDDGATTQRQSSAIPSIPSSIAVAEPNIEDQINKLFPGFLDIDLLKPPGLVGAICENLASWEHRALPELRAMAAINIVSLLCKDRLNGDGRQLSVFLIGIAPSASGKGDHIAYTNFLLSKIGIGQFVYADPRSDKSIYLDLFGSGNLVYLVDEVQSLFAGMLSKSSSEYTQSMLSLLMKLNTASSVTLPGNIQRDLQIDNPTMLNPFIGFAGYSTPSELSFILSDKNIHSGLLGRFLFFPGTHARRRKRKDVRREINDCVLSRCLNMIGNTDKIIMSEFALKALNLIDDLLDQDEYLNHPRLGAIYARGSEQVKRIAYIFGAEDGTVVEKDILYALHLFISSVKSCLESHDPANLETEALEIAKEHATDWILKSVLANKLTKNRYCFRRMHEDKPGSHYQIIESLIKRKKLLASGKKVKISL